MPQLDFEGHNTLYATHGLHAYAAKCPPQLVRYALKYYSKRGEIVLDPMSGSGTTLVEAKLLGRSGIGFDIDPLARLIAEVKSTPLADDEIVKAFQKIQDRIEAWTSELEITPITIPSFEKREYWFCTKVSEALAFLATVIRTEAMDQPQRNFFWVVFSSLILSRTSVANARDIVHSRHHRYDHEVVPDVFQKFSTKVRSMRRQMSEFTARLGKDPETTQVFLGDARDLTLDDESVDLVFTSPPYVTALDYTRSHFLAVPWLSPELGVSIEQYRNGAANYIGTERKPSSRVDADDRVSGITLLDQTLAKLEKASIQQAVLTERYFSDMKKALTEMHRVLKSGRHAVIVICPSHIRKVQIPSHTILMEIGKSIGLRPKQCHTRVIDARRRLLPFAKGDASTRMTTEFVLLFQK